MDLREKSDKLQAIFSMQEFIKSPEGQISEKKEELKNLQVTLITEMTQAVRETGYNLTPKELAIFVCYLSNDLQLDEEKISLYQQNIFQMQDRVTNHNSELIYLNYIYKDYRGADKNARILGVLQDIRLSYDPSCKACSIYLDVSKYTEDIRSAGVVWSQASLWIDNITTQKICSGDKEIQIEIGNKECSRFVELAQQIGLI